ncbi:MAG TPA: glycosyltransferase [Gemmatimonadaceae bacterium]|nr:glycosyltransferase [Gemmatimonadaceae bacterium]
METPSRLAIVVPVKNDERVFRLIDRLADSKAIDSCEVIVACNGATSDFAERVQHRLKGFPRAGCITDSVASPPRAINCAAREAKSSHLLILDSDCEPCEGYIDCVLAAIDSHAIARGQIIFTGTTAFSRTSARWRQSFYDRVAREGRLYAPNLLIERETFLTLGGFVESLRHAYDSEFSDRALKSGKAAFFLSSAMVVHECHADIRTEMRIWFNYGCGRYYRMNGARTIGAYSHALLGDIPWSTLDNAPIISYALAYVAVRAAGFVFAAAGIAR